MRLIDADALMAKLGIGQDCSICEHDDTPYCRWKPDVVDVCEAICDAPTIEPQQRWTPCSERLPENGRYLVSVNLSVFSPQILNYDSDEDRWFYDGCKSIDFDIPPIIAWMPLPEPYREDGE